MAVWKCGRFRTYNLSLYDQVMQVIRRSRLAEKLISRVMPVSEIR